jgi:hypothetical protein
MAAKISVSAGEDTDARIGGTQSVGRNYVSASTSARSECDHGAGPDEHPSPSDPVMAVPSYWHATRVKRAGNAANSTVLSCAAQNPVSLRATVVP